MDAIQKELDGNSELFEYQLILEGPPEGVLDHSTKCSRYCIGLYIQMALN